MVKHTSVSKIGPTLNNVFKHWHSQKKKNQIRELWKIAITAPEKQEKAKRGEPVCKATAMQDLGGINNFIIGSKEKQ